ncbi:hypothetical protein H2248_002380 [Termitomyces sp. 'cryptogamus']|nr:hypothetical protein H2248_002380 [Termitomyces sp. 'cryptogamus']
MAEIMYVGVELGARLRPQGNQCSKKLHRSSQPIIPCSIIEEHYRFLSTAILIGIDIRFFLCRTDVVKGPLKLYTTSVTGDVSIIETFTETL